MTSDGMQIDNQDSSSPETLSTLSMKEKSLPKKITVEDSMDVISELINEIQATEDLVTDIPPHPEPPQDQSISPSSIRFSLAHQRGASPPANFLPSLCKFFHVLLSTCFTHILPVRNDSKASPMKLSSQVNELTLTGVKVFFRASKPNTSSLAGDFPISLSFSFKDLSSNELISNWLALHGYYMVLCDCQDSDMIRIGFLSRVSPYLWRDDLKDMIKESELFQSNPFQFRLYPGSLSSIKKGAVAPVLMVEVERENVLSGLDFFCKSFDGENPLSPCGIPYLFLTLIRTDHL
jgi:hypothetical protein